MKAELQKLLLQHLERNEPAPSHELKTRYEVFAFLAGVATAFSLFLGRGVTAAEADLTLRMSDEYCGDAWLVLEGLDDWQVVRATELPNGEMSYPLINRVGISAEHTREHNHSITCPGCKHCPNFFRKIPTTA